MWRMAAGTALLWAWMAQGVLAQGTQAEDERVALEAQVEAVRARIEALEKQPGAEESLFSDLEYEISLTKGIGIRSADGRHEIRLGGRLHADFRGFESDYPTTTRFLVRRARLELQARVWRDFHLKVQGDFAGGVARMTDGFASFQPMREVGVQAGQFYVPFSLEDSGMADNTLLLVERSFAVTNISPERDLGAMVFGSVADGAFDYLLGVFNGPGRFFAENNDDKDAAGRIVLRPFRLFLEKTDLLSGIQLGGAFTYGHQSQNVGGATFLQTSGGTTFARFTPTARIFERRLRLGAEFGWFGGPFAVICEALFLRFDEIELGASPLPPAPLRPRTRLDTWGYTAAASFMITGENRFADFIAHEDEDGKSVQGPISPFPDGPGAFEIAARWAQLDTERNALSKGFVTGAVRADAFSVGLTWWLRENVRFMINYERVLFDRELNRPKSTLPPFPPGTGIDEVNNEDVVFARFAIWF